jgi:hypothetical protein
VSDGFLRTTRWTGFTGLALIMLGIADIRMATTNINTLLDDGRGHHFYRGVSKNFVRFEEVPHAGRRDVMRQIWAVPFEALAPN